MEFEFIVFARFLMSLLSLLPSQFELYSMEQLVNNVRQYSSKAVKGRSNAGPIVHCSKLVNAGGADAAQR